MHKAGLLLDMDGVIYRGGRLVEGSAEFLARLRSLNIPFMFLIWSATT